MKIYIQFLMGFVALSGICMAADIMPETIERLKSSTLTEKALSSHLNEDEIDKLGEKILGGNLVKGEIDKFGYKAIQGLMDWIQDNMYGGVLGFCGEDQFVKIARSLAKNNAVELEFGEAMVGTDSKLVVKYISKINILDLRKVKGFLQKLNDRTAKYNKKYPYQDD